MVRNVNLNSLDVNELETLKENLEKEEIISRIIKLLGQIEVKDDYKDQIIRSLDFRSYEELYNIYCDYRSIVLSQRRYEERSRREKEEQIERSNDIKIAFVSFTAIIVTIFSVMTANKIDNKNEVYYFETLQDFIDEETRKILLNSTVKIPIEDYDENKHVGVLGETLLQIPKEEGYVSIYDIDKLEQLKSKLIDYIDDYIEINPEYIDCFISRIEANLPVDEETYIKYIKDEHIVYYDVDGETCYLNENGHYVPYYYVCNGCDECLTSNISLSETFEKSNRQLFDDVRKSINVLKFNNGYFINLDEMIDNRNNIDYSIGGNTK